MTMLWFCNSFSRSSSKFCVSFPKLIFIIIALVLVEQELRFLLDATNAATSPPPPPTTTTTGCLMNIIDTPLLSNEMGGSNSSLSFSSAETNTTNTNTNTTTTTKNKKQGDDVGFFVEKKTKKRLEFVHIPKTGGTSIENVALKHNITWGVCKFISPSASKLNKLPFVCPNINEITKLNYRWQNTTVWYKLFPGMLPCKATNWHLPSYFFDRVNGNLNPYYNSDLFAVVRNPYTRIVSEYYYRRKIINDTKLVTPERFNKWIERFIQPRLKFVNDTNPWSDQNFCTTQGHLIPQHYFIYTGSGRKVVDHVLKFENLQEEFDTLMIEYGLNISLNEEPALFMSRNDDDDEKDKDSTTTTTKTETETILGVENLTLKSRQLIEHVYAMDFKIFGYSYLDD